MYNCYGIVHCCRNKENEEIEDKNFKKKSNIDHGMEFVIHNKTHKQWWRKTQLPLELKKKHRRFVAASKLNTIFLTKTWNTLIWGGGGVGCVIRVFTSVSLLGSFHKRSSESTRFESTRFINWPCYKCHNFCNPKT